MGEEIKVSDLVDGIGQKFNEAVGTLMASLQEKREEAVTADQQQAVVQEFEDRYKALEASHEELKRQVAESRFTPVVDMSARELRYPLTPDVLLEAPADEATLAGQKLNDELYLMAALTGRCDEKGRVTDVEGLKNSKTFQRAVNRYGKALDTVTSGMGLEWVPTGFSSNLIEAVMLDCRVAALFNRIPMPTPSYTAPVGLGVPKAYKATQGSDRIEATDSLTSSATFTAKPIAVYVPITQEATEDVFMPILTWVQQQMARGIANGIENCCINGDVTATHMDTDTAAEGADAVATCWSGLRYKGLNTTGCKIDISTFNADTLVSLKTALGKYGLDPNRLAWIMGTKLLNAMLLLRDSQNNLLMATIDKYGPQATVVTGEVGRFLNIPIIPSAYMRENLDNTGVNGASGNTYASNLLVNRDAWFLGDRKSVTLEQQKRIRAQVWDLVTSWRGDFQHVYAATECTTAVGYKG